MNCSFRIVLKTLTGHWLFPMFQKCGFCPEFIVFLKHIVSSDGIMLNLVNIEAICGLARPTSVTKIQSFIRMVRYYTNFVEDSSTIEVSLTLFTWNNIPFFWRSTRGAFRYLGSFLLSLLYCHF